MSAWVCPKCTAAYSVGALRCPHCGHPSMAQEGGTNMPKITAHGGATVTTDDTGGEQPSPVGTTSSTSSTKDAPSPQTNGSEAPSRARTTASRSKKARTGSSSAAGTDGDPTEPTSATASDN